MSFTHLQVKSGYSLMESSITIDKLVKKAKELQFKSLALTDHHVLHGAIPFYKACSHYDIKPIIGMTVNVEEQDGKTEQCILLAENNDGYQQLIHISTELNTTDIEAIKKEELSHFSKGLICILPVFHSCLRNMIKNSPYEEIMEEVKVWQNVFTHENFYLGIQDHGLVEERELQQPLKAFSDFYNLQVVAINDVRYLEEKDVLAYDCLQAMKKGTKWNGQQSTATINHHHLRSSLEMEQVFDSFWPSVLKETNNIANKCSLTFDFTKRMLPTYSTPDNTSSHEFLKELCWKNVKLKYKTLTEQITERLEYELDVIQSMKFSDYFLIVWDFINYAKSKNIFVGPGRGSSAGSIVAFVLGITDVDPLKHKLLFERFLNPERISMPDIDVDFSDHRRDEVIDYVQQKYGKENVAQIITFGTYAARSLIRELIKTMGVDQQDAYFILQSIPIQSRKTLVELITSSPQLKEYINQSNQMKLLFSIAVKLEGLPRHISTHAAGVVISDQPLVKHVPLVSGTHNLYLTQFTMNDLEAVGLLKIDFLGLKNLTLIERILQSICYTENKNIDMTAIPENDSFTFQLLQKGRTNGVFQLESKGMKSVLKRLKPSEIEDIVAVNALYRPGPMDFIPTYIKRKHNQEKVTYPHPDLQHILEETYGVLIYQEQIMLIAHEIAGFSLGEADLLRRAVSKKQHKLMAEQKKLFVDGCMKLGYTKSVSEELFAWIVKFSNYGFPKSHAVAYSKISYQLAYLKAHYPKNFYSELLSSIVNQHEKVRLYINEMKNNHINIFPPSINKSFGKYTVENSGVRMGLLSIKGIGYQVVNEIINVRKSGLFKSLFDFCLRVSSTIINRTILEQLILAGTFDELYDNRASLLASIDTAIEQGALFREFSDLPSLFEDELELEMEYVSIGDFNDMKKLADEKELVGIYLSKHPLAEHRKILRANGYMSLNKTIKMIGRRNIQSVVIIQHIKTIRTKRGDPMAFLTLSDETREMEAVLFPELYRKTNRSLQENKIVSIQGTPELRNEQVQFLINELEPFNMLDLSSKPYQSLFIKITELKNDIAMQKIKEVAEKYPGTTPVIVYDDKANRTYRLSEKFKLHLTDKCLLVLNDYFGKVNVVVKENSSNTHR